MSSKNKHFNSCAFPLTSPPVPGFLPAYGNFWLTVGGITIPINNPIPFNQTGPTTGGVSLVDPTTIRIAQGGDYFISYVVTVNLLASGSRDAALSLFLNGDIVPNLQTTFAINGDNEDVCLQISGQAILSIPNNSTLQLVNTDPSSPSDLVTCDSRVNNAAINIIKLSA